MATELQINKSSEAVEPSPASNNRQPSFIARFESRLQTLPCGRHTLGCLQWCVVAALVLSGFYGAEVINSGVQLAMRNDSTTSQHILVVATPPTAHK